MLRGLLVRLRPSLLTVQVASMGASLLVLGVIAMVTLDTVSERMQRAIGRSEAAMLSAVIDHSADYVDLLLQSDGGWGG